MNLSQQIKKFRERDGFSQDKLAAMIFVSRQTISNWENGRSYPDVQNLLLLGELFGVSLDELVKGDVETMKEQVNNSEFRRLNLIMNGTLIFTAIMTVPLGFFLSLWGFVVLLPLCILMFWSTIKLEKVNYSPLS